MDQQKLTTPEEKLVEFVMNHLNKWRDDMRANYYNDWDRYERMWLGIHSTGDSERKSERSRIISPDTQQAIESYEADMIEAVFGGPKWFDIDDNVADEDKTDVERMKNQLTEDFKTDKVQTAIKECITYAAVFGKGIGEIILSDGYQMKPKTVEMGGMALGGVETNDRFCVKLKPVSPRNFLIDPAATCIEDAMGCAVEEVVSAHRVIENQRKGVYRDVPIDSYTPSDEDEPITQSTMPYKDNQVHITKYYGLVPRHLLEDIKNSNVSKEDEDSLDAAVGVDSPDSPFEDYADLVEAIVVIANDRTLLKAEATPYMMKDRPIVAYDCDPIPGKFWGRGIAQKGLMMQSAIDAQIRMHLDSLALTAAPMVALDATRLPRGFKFEIYPGRSVKFNGNPAEVAMPFKFGDTSAQILETAGILERKFLQATGTLDAAGMAAEGGNAGQNAGVSLALQGIIKKQRRSLMNFTDNFLIPFVQKAAWRYMQFDPDRYPVKDYKFIPMSTLGLIAREYEQQHLMAVMSTLGPESPLVPMLMVHYVENSGLQNKQQLIKQLQEAMKPNPEAEQAQKEAMELEKRAVMAKLLVDESTAAVNKAKEADIKVQTQLRPFEAKAALLGNLTKNSEEADEFNQRVQIAELSLKELKLNMDAADSIRDSQIVERQMSQQDRKLDIEEKKAQNRSKAA
jgi:hypothetical protein